MPDSIVTVLERIAQKLETRTQRTAPRVQPHCPALPQPQPSPSPAPSVPLPCPPSAPAPVSSKYVTVCGASLHCLEAGPPDADPVLFVHGNPTSSFLWRNIIPVIGASSRCIALDLVGMGKSDKPNIPYRLLDHAKYFEGFIEQLGLRNLTLVLHDWGAALGFMYLAHHAGNVKRVAFMEALLKPYPSWDAFPFSNALKQSAIPKLLIYHPNGVITAEPEAAWCRANLKNLEVVRLEGEVPAPIHFLQERFPRETADALANWLRRQ